MEALPLCVGWCWKSSIPSTFQPGSTNVHKQLTWAPLVYLACPLVLLVPDPVHLSSHCRSQVINSPFLFDFLASRVRSVMAWGGSPPGSTCLCQVQSAHIVWFYASPPLWETGWRQAAARTLPLQLLLSAETHHPLKYGTPANPNVKLTSSR